MRPALSTPTATACAKPDGVPMSILYQTSTNAVRQDFQALIKQWWSEIGIETELRNIDASVFFGGDPGSPDTFQKFYADVEMYANTFNGTDPQAYLGNGLCDKARVPRRQWQGENISRFCMEEYDALHAELTRPPASPSGPRIGRELNDMLSRTADDPAGAPRPSLGPCQHAWTACPERLGQRAVERRRLVPHRGRRRVIRGSPEPPPRIRPGRGPILAPDIRPRF
jgi:hypothetical protein